MLLQLENVSKTYATQVPVPVLEGVDLEIDNGQVAAIMGPSGSGKSTLLNVMGALTEADSGRVLFNGRDLNDLNSRELAYYRNQEIGFVFQQHFLLPQLTLLENVLMPALAFYEKEHAAALRERAIKLLTRVDLLQRKDHRPGQLSGGECQRAAVVRALINTPKLLLADEPTGSLDQKTAGALMDLLLELNHEEAVALIVVTHSVELAEQIKVKHLLTNGRLNRI